MGNLEKFLHDQPRRTPVLVKAAAGGELAGVGRLGVSGKTTCRNCNVCSQCFKPPTLQELIDQYGRPDVDRDYERIEKLAVEAEGSSAEFVGRNGVG